MEEQFAADMEHYLEAMFEPDGDKRTSRVKEVAKQHARIVDESPFFAVMKSGRKEKHLPVPLCPGGAKSRNAA